MDFITPNWPAPSHIKAYTTVRTSWGGEKYDHPHFIHPDDDHSYRTDNSRLKNLLHLPQEPIWLKQIHSNIALPALSSSNRMNGDAIYSATSNQVCLVLTADCLPILICDQKGSEVAAIHAGWRGLANGVIEATLDALTHQGPNLLVWLGPAIGPKRFEVGKDVFDAFTQKHPEAAIAFEPHGDGKWLANLYALAKLRLQKRGITQIYGGDFCTYTQEDLFFSYRREKGTQGRMASVIWLSA